MKSRVNQSIFSFILTVIVIGLLTAALVFTYDTSKFVLTAAMVVILLTFGMYYSPLSISADEKEIRVHSPLKIHTIPMRRVVGVELYQPTMSALRVCGAGGFMGYWGIFKEGDTGRYMAYYGKASDCFLVRLDNGDKYVLGCRNPQKMIDYISAHLKND